MKILITGATGLIGKELVSLLINKGHSVNYLTTSQNKISVKPNYIGFYWNPNQAILDINCLINVDVIIHLAGASISKKWTASYKKEILESRIQTTQLLFSTLENNPHQVKQFITASGTAIYPESFNKSYSESTTEVSETGFLANVVKEWEQSTDSFKQLKIKVCKLRTGIVLAKNGGALPEMLKPIQYGLGANMGNGKQIQSWIHIQDLVNAYYFAIQNELEGIFNTVAPNPVSYSELTKTIAKTLGRPLFLPNIPQFFMKFILGEMSVLLFSSKNVSAKKIVDLGFQFRFPNIKEAIQDILK